MNHLQSQIVQQARKTSAEESLLSFMDQAWSVVEPDRPFLYGWHIQMIAEHLEAVADGRIRNLVINVPPGCCKSLLVSVFWPCWVWATRPRKRWMFASYQEELAVRDSMKCRLLIESEWYQQRWGSRVVISDDANKRARFGNTATGWRLSTSVEGRGTGEHPDIIVADDPHKVKGVESDTERQSVTDWWDGTISSRGVIHKSARVIVMQRVHQSDLSGHVLKTGDYEHLCLPMEAEPERQKVSSLGWSDPRTQPGELLWPEAFDQQTVTALKRAMGSYHAAGQLQQRPAPRGGGYFKRDWFPVVRAVPEGCRWIRFWDLAATKNRRSDYTSGCLLGHKDGVWYVKHIRRDQLTPMGVERTLKQCAEADGVEVQVVIEKEPGASGELVIHNYVTAMAGFSVRGVRPRDLGSKEARADAMSAQAEAGNIKLVNGPWVHALLDELEIFPAGDNDDQVDSLSGGFMAMARRRSQVVVSPITACSR